MDVFQVTVCVEKTGQNDVLFGDMMRGATTMSSLRLAASRGDAVVEAARARAEKRAVKNCMDGVVEIPSRRWNGDCAVEWIEARWGWVG